MYNPPPQQTYRSMPPATSNKRYPLVNAVNHQANAYYPTTTTMQPAPASKTTTTTPVRDREREKDRERERPPAEQKEKDKEPPLPRQNSKTRPPSPPKVISDKNGRVHYQRVGFLGEGGFARVYEVQDPRGSRIACKVVTKSALKTKKAKTKLYAEIKIHRSLAHPNIVTFLDCFEDEANVYITLALCRSGSLMDLLRRRRRFTEPEVRVFMVQLIGACHYMHTHQVIHRDLKLGNLFLDGDMNVKVGDFGLAALIENPGERKKTICGTPNYIAPEVLFDTANGHSFEVDIWSIGVILYTLVVGRPPFQTSEVKEIYKRIRDNTYDFPATPRLSSSVKALISGTLTPLPSERPTLHDILDDVWFSDGICPPYVPTSAHDGAPEFRNVTREMSEKNLRALRRAAGVYGDVWEGEDGEPSGTVPAAAPRNVATSIAQQEKEFQKAVQPGSPISALLSSARQPLMVGPQYGGGPPHRDSPLLRKLQAASVKESPLGRRSVTRTAQGTTIVEEEEGGRVARAGSLKGRRGLGAVDERNPTARNAYQDQDDEEEEDVRLRTKELEAQKARIVAQMAPVKEEEEGYDDASEGEEDVEERQRRERYAQEQREKERRDRYAERERRDAGKGKAIERPREKERVGERERGTRDNFKENLPGAGSYPTLNSAQSIPTSSSSAAMSKLALPSAQPLASSSRTRPNGLDARAPTPVSDVNSESGGAQPKNGFDAAAQTLTLAFEARAAGRVYVPASSGSGGYGYSMEELGLPEERVFIVSWVDYCNKYGMGYALTDGSVGVHFNDSTSLVLSADKRHFDYISSRRPSAPSSTSSSLVYLRKSHTVETYPVELKSKVYLLKHFEKYIMERLYGEYAYTFEDVERNRGMEWVVKYLRMKHVIVFLLSHGVLQFNFYDHTKVILSSCGMLVTHIDKAYNLTRYTLSQVMAFALDPGAAGLDDDQRKFMQKLVDKLKYCKEVLVSIRSASGSEGEGAPAESGSTNSNLNMAGSAREKSSAPGASSRDRDRLAPSGSSAASLAKRTSKLSLR